MPETSTALLSLLIVILVVVILWAIARLDSTVRRAERKLDIFMRCSGYDPTQIATLEAESLARAGRKAEAIKVYRELTGASLTQAKSVVDGFK
jgi:ribosomal protein L7/L12